MNRFGKVFSFFIVLFMLATVMAGCTPTPAATEAPATKAPVVATEAGAAVEATAAPVEAGPYLAPKITVAVQGDPSNLGPFVGMSLGRIGVLTTMYEYLFYQVGPELTPYIAKGYEKVADNTYDVTIFENITDSAGNHVTAADVASSYTTAMGLGNLQPLGDLASVTAKSDYVAEFVTKTDLGNGLKKVLTECPIVSQKAYEASADQMATKPITTAAYKLTEYIPGSSLTFERRADYWQTDSTMRPVVTKANVQIAVFQIIAEPSQHTIALQTGAADISAAVPGSDVPLFEGQPGFSVIRKMDNLTNLLAYNGSEGHVLNNKDLRMALSYAINRQALCDAVSPGACYPSHEIGNPNFIGYLAKWDTEPYYEYDLAKAKEFFAASGAPADLSLTLLATSQPPSTGLVCQVIQAQLAELGINVNIVQVDPPVFNTEKYDPTKWDLLYDAAAGGDFVFSPWQLMFDQNRYNGTTSNWFKDDQLQTLISAAATAPSDANADAAWQYIKETNYMQALFSYVNNTVSFDQVTSVFLDSRGFIVPGACEYVQK
ncbi:MAG TPA: ABC transporter substrate-binding protein [Anaerolineaceae bacterium]|nr:ABC transporter substrate-binding protein [Anaerolineaceae bacterium]